MADITKNDIVSISTKIIKDNPFNPRMDMGNLKELTDSIKVNGILQPITVVEDNNKYVIIMGHRRFHAAVEAGLKAVPCRVVKMSVEEQKSVMLMENMQRQDLNAYEQAQGFQMMLDLGLKPKDIAEKTGFSQKVIKERASWAKLDKELLKQRAEETQIDFNDLTELSKIKDEKARNKLLKTVGTDDFDYNLMEAQREQAYVETRDKWLKILKAKNAKELAPSDNKLKYHNIVSLNKYSYKPELELKDGEEYLYCLDKNSLTIYSTKSATETYFGGKDKKKYYKELTEEDKAREAAEEKLENLMGKEKNIEDSMWDLRNQFAKNYEADEKDLPAIIDVLCDALSEGYASIDFVPLSLYNVTGIDLENEECVEEDQDDAHIKETIEKAKEKPYKVLFGFAYASIENASRLVGRWGEEEGQFQKSEMLEYTYSFLEKFGYRISSIEKKMLNGEHEIYKELQKAKEELDALK